MTYQHLLVKHEGTDHHDHPQPAREAQRAGPRRDARAHRGAAGGGRQRRARRHPGRQRPGVLGRPQLRRHERAPPGRGPAPVRGVHRDDGHRPGHPPAGGAPRSTRWPPPPAASSWPSCDLAVAAEDAGFAIPGGKGGLFCHTPLVAVARNIGRKRALEMAFTGDADRRPHRRRVGPRQPGRARRPARRGHARSRSPGPPGAARRPRAWASTASTPRSTSRRTRPTPTPSS